MTCKLCRAVGGDGDEPLLLHDPAGVVLLSDDWSVRGHIVVVARSHVENTSELPADEAARFFELLTRAERAVLDFSGADRAVLMKLGLAVPHLHVHVYPVTREATREEVFAAINLTSRVDLPADERDRFVAGLRDRMEER